MLIEKRNGKIKKQLETIQVSMWIKFKGNKHISRSSTSKSSHLIFLKRKEGNIPSKDIVFFNENQSKEKLP